MGRYLEIARKVREALAGVPPAPGPVALPLLPSKVAVGQTKLGSEPPVELPPHVQVIQSDAESEAALQELLADEGAVGMTAAPPLLAVDLETTGLDPHQDKVRLVTVATGNTVKTIDAFATPSWLRMLAKLFEERVIVLHHSQFDLGFLLAAGCPLPERLFDTMLAAQLLDGGEHYKRKGYFTLAAVAERFLGRSLDKQLQTSDWSGDLTPAQLAYAAADAGVLLPLAERLQQELVAKKLARASKLEMETIPAVAWLTFTGAPFDADRWLRLAGVAEREREEAKRELVALLGDVNPNAPDQVLGALQKLGVPVTGTSEEELARHREHPAVAALLRYREAAKLASTYGRSFVAEHVNPVTGRIHPHYRQIGAATGRMACRDPNLQNIPRDPRYRSCFRPPAGRVLVKADLSQIELVTAACLAEDRRMLRALREGKDLHALTAAALYGVPVEQVTKAQRAVAKMVNFGTLYGQGVPGLVTRLAALGLALSETGAADLLRRFDRTWPGLALWRRAQMRGVGEVRTVSGRLRVLEGEQATQRVNTPVQGAAADCFKAALASLWRTRHECPTAAPVLAVHDELVVEVAVEEAERAAEWVQGCLEEGVRRFFPDAPVRVEVTICSDWSGAPAQVPTVTSVRYEK